MNMVKSTANAKLPALAALGLGILVGPASADTSGKKIAFSNN